MDRLGTRVALWGFLLVGWGALWLADTTGIVDVSPMLFATFFALAGAAFAVVFARDPRSWWAAMPAGALLGLTALIAFVENTTAPDPWGASILLAGSGLGFGAAYLRSRDHWWTLIPTGALLSIALIVASVPVLDGGVRIGAFVVALMAATLVALALVPIRGRRVPWALLPAGVLGIVAVFLARDEAEALEPFNWVSPLALLLVGLVLVVRTRSGRGTGRQNP